MSGARETMNLSQLIERCEKAEGPDEALDLDLCCAFPETINALSAKPDDEGGIVYRHSQGTGWCQAAPAFTSSIDAALSLVERKGWRLHSVHHGVRPWWVEICRPNNAAEAFEADHATFPLALILALLRAIHAKEEQR